MNALERPCQCAKSEMVKHWLSDLNHNCVLNRKDVTGCNPDIFAAKHLTTDKMNHWHLII